MANELTGSPTLRLPEDLAQEFKRREIAALMRPRAVGLLGLSGGGRALALRLAERGMRVTLLPYPELDLDAAVAELNSLLDDAAAADVGGEHARVSVAANPQALRGHELVIECGVYVGDLDTRIRGYRKLLATVEADTPLATMVRSLDEATAIEAMGPGAGRIVPIHLPLGDYAASIVQVIRSPFVHRSAIVRAQRVFDASGIFVVRAPASSGLLVDRLLLAVINEACRMIGSNLTDIESVDRIFRIHTLHGLGPLQAADLIGLDVLGALGDELFSSTGDERYRPPRLLRAYIEQGFLGKKTGRGFYQYSTWSR